MCLLSGGSGNRLARALDTRRMAGYALARMADTAKLLKELIATPSVNPAFLPLGHPNAGEAGVADLLSRMARRAGMDVELHKLAPGRHNVFVRLCPRRNPGRTVWLAPHMDTVNGVDEQFRPKLVGDRLYGRGACDTKGALAAMLGAMKDLAVQRRRPEQTEIVLTALADEENAHLGSRALVSSGSRAHLAIVGEPTMNRVVTAHKGSLWIQIETAGTAAHGSRPELGENAVHEMARIVDYLQTAYTRRLAKRRHDLLGVPTVSVGAISGGTQPNIVPDHCTILVDRRTLPGETKRSVLKELSSLLRKKGFKGTISLTRDEEDLAMETDPGLDLVTKFLKSVRQKKPAGVDYFCDASILAGDGTPSVVFGPGSIAQAHTADEWISIRALENCRALLGRFLGSLP